MEKVKIRKSDVVVRFNEGLYDKKFINRAIRDFSRACNVKKVKKEIILKPKNKEEIRIIGYEFYNYVLGLMKNAD